MLIFSFFFLNNYMNSTCLYFLLLLPILMYQFTLRGLGVYKSWSLRDPQFHATLRRARTGEREVMWVPWCSASCSTSWISAVKGLVVNVFRYYLVLKSPFDGPNTLEILDFTRQHLFLRLCSTSDWVFQFEAGLSWLANSKSPILALIPGCSFFTTPFIYSIYIYWVLIASYIPF